jgi:hypothetical protein
LGLQAGGTPTNAQTPHQKIDGTFVLQLLGKCRIQAASAHLLDPQHLASQIGKSDVRTAPPPLAKR